MDNTLSIKHLEVDNMKFVKGMIVGTLISAGVVMAYTDSMNGVKKRAIKKGRQFARKLGMM